MTNRKMLNSTAYKTYLAFATGVATPKKARKFKKLASPLKKKILVAVEEPAKNSAKKPTTRRQSVGVQIRDTPGVSVSKKKAPAKTERSKGIEFLSKAVILEEAQLKKAIKRSKRETDIHQAGGSSEGAGLEPEVPDEQKGKSTDTNSDDDDDDDQQSNDEGNESNNDKDANLNKTDDEKEDEFVHTHNDYVPTDDENIDDEEYDRINKEMYSDVNVELKEIETADEEKGDQVNDHALEIVTTALTTQKTRVPLQSSSISSDYATKFLNFDNIPLTDIEIISMLDIKVQHEDPCSQTSPLLTVPISLFCAAIKSKVPTVVKEYLGTSLDDTLHKVIQRHTTELIKGHSIPADVVEVPQQQQKP
ncbi:hypothetical protein Tco_0736772 [Tanacetum coccineum]